MNRRRRPDSDRKLPIGFQAVKQRHIGMFGRRQPSGVAMIRTDQFWADNFLAVKSSSGEWAVEGLTSTIAYHLWVIRSR
jgi:hypothetical protein